MNTKMHTVLAVNASGRRTGSVTRLLSHDLVEALRDRYGRIDVLERDLAKGIPLVDGDWIEANFTPDEEQSQAHRDTLAVSDELVRELQRADTLVIGVPIYNFSVPASLKAWIDMVARARVTFRYTANGPVGLLEGKKAYLVVASGGVPVGSAVDFATPYLRHALSFIGISDVEVVAADRNNSDMDDALDRARAGIAEVVHLSSYAA